MRVLTLAGVSVALALTMGIAGPKAAGCDPVGKIQFICGQIGPEDLAVVPGGEWVIASSDAANGAIRLIRISDKTTTILFPTAAPMERLDKKTYDTCPGPIDPAEKERFRAHGLYLLPGKNAKHTLYVVHHGLRESIEVFEFDAKAKSPTLTWIGCAIPPDPVGLNSVVALPDGGFVSTNYLARGDAAGRAKMMAGENNGELWEWHTGTGWKIVPGTEASGANGIEISKDGKWLYMAGWGNRTFMRFSRGQTPMKKDVVQLDFRIDNIRWAPDGMLLLAGQGGGDTLFGRGQPPGAPTPSPSPAPVATSNVVKLDPKTLKFVELVREPYNDTFGFTTVAIQVGKELWLGSVRGDKLARFPLDPQKSR